MTDKKHDQKISYDCVLFEYIKQLVIAMNKGRSVIERNTVGRLNGKEIILGNARYLLSQTLRQLIIDKNHWHISKAAKEKMENDDGITVSYDFLLKYMINANLTLKNNHKKFNKEYAVDHVVPVSRIMNEMMKMEKAGELSYEAIMNKLDEIHVCIITHQEDDLLITQKYRQKRDGSYEEIVRNGAYAKVGIIVCESDDLGD